MKKILHLLPLYFALLVCCLLMHSCTSGTGRNGQIHGIGNTVDKESPVSLHTESTMKLKFRQAQQE